MKIFVRTFLVIVCLLGFLSTPVQAGDILQPGDIAIIGYRFGTNAEFSFVCLRVISEGTEIKFTDNGWKENQTFRTGEGSIAWVAPTGGCELGQIVNVKKSSDPYANIDLDTTGDQIIAFQGYYALPSLIFALNSREDGWQTGTINGNSSTLPNILAVLSPSPSIAIPQSPYAVYSKLDRNFTSTSAALAFVTDPANWTRSTSPLAMPTGNFSFTTTAVHLSEFSAEVGGEVAPWWVLVGLVIVPVVLMVFKRPKRGCCK